MLVRITRQTKADSNKVYPGDVVEVKDSTARTLLDLGKAEKLSFTPTHAVGRKQGLISVIIPHYNIPDHLAKCLDSLRRQTYNHLEIIVVDDGSSTANYKQAQRLCTDCTLLQQHNHGAPSARNAGAMAASGEYLYFCDADIVNKHNCLLTMLSSLHADPGAAWAYCNYRLGGDVKKFEPYTRRRLQSRNICSTMSLMKWSAFPGWDKDIKRLQDWDLFLTMAAQGFNGVWIDEVLFDAAYRKDGITYGSIGWKEAVKAVRAKHDL